MCRRRSKRSGAESELPHISGIPCRSSTNWTCQNNAAPGVYYHYTSLETLWAILNTETIRATQARFSNDSEELQQGIRILNEFISSFSSAWKEVITPEYIQRLLRGESVGIDCYIVCLCKEDDILSQWRGYCYNGGVSIGFAFDETCPYFYLAADPKCETGKHPFRLDQVWYIVDSTDATTKLSDGVYSRPMLMKLLQEKFKCVPDEADPGSKAAFFESAVPLIKHAGFCEEKEARLLIFNDPATQIGELPTPLTPYVEYAKTGRGVQRPYLALSFCRPRSSDRQESASMPTIDFYNLSDEVQKEFEAILPCRFPSIQIRRVSTNSKSPKPQIVIGEAEADLQRKIFFAIVRVLDAHTHESPFAAVRVWCAGHLPIRSIRVSPCQNQQEIIEAIRHYCSHHSYWLKYVEVTGSRTPYRSPQ